MQNKTMLSTVRLLAALGLSLLPACLNAASPPGFSDANWSSLGPAPGPNTPVLASVVDASGNLYIGGNFTAVGGVAAAYIAKWDGSSWSALGAGLNAYVDALAVSGTDLY